MSFAPSVVTVFDAFTNRMQKDFSDGKADDIARSMRQLRVMAIAAGILSAIGGVVLTSLAVGLASATYGFSAILLLPTAALFTVCFDSYKLVHICDIAVERAEQGDFQTLMEVLPYTPLWIERMRKEVNSSILLNFLLNSRA